MICLGFALLLSSGAAAATSVEIDCHSPVAMPEEEAYAIVFDLRAKLTRGADGYVLSDFTGHYRLLFEDGEAEGDGNDTRAIRVIRVIENEWVRSGAARVDDDPKYRPIKYPNSVRFILTPFFENHKDAWLVVPKSAARGPGFKAYFTIRDRANDRGGTVTLRCSVEP